ncbi:MAG: outer membrane beta-barrel protein [Bacteroidales bacterium]|nr:outer membrane beta-barrel protein [Bacteroidales bacterium]
MKKILLFLLIALSVPASAQDDPILNYQKIDHKPFHFGYTLGLNTMDFGIYPSEASLSPESALPDTFPEINRLSPGIDIGIVTNFRLTEYLDFRFLPGISLGQRNLNYYTHLSDVSQDPSNGVQSPGNVDSSALTQESPMNIGSTFINVPVALRYEAKRYYNFRPYIIGGVNFRWDMARNKDFNVSEGIFVKLKPFDVYLEGGMGMDFYLPYFKLSVELKLSVGTLNVLDPDKHENKSGYVNSIDKLKSRMVSLSFHFE